jgi:hypothetical protein
LAFSGSRRRDTERRLALENLMRARNSALRALLVSLALFVAPAAGAKPWVTAWFPFEIVHNSISVPIKIAGTETRAMFDTGSEVAFVDREFAEAHGVLVADGFRAKVVGAHSSKSVPLAREVPIELFGASVRLRNVPAGPLGRLGEAKIIVGLDVLRAFVLQIDYANSRIRFASRDAVNLDTAANVEMRRIRGKGLLAVRAKLDGDPVWLMLDTGMSGPMQLTSRLMESRGWQKLGEAPSLDVHGTQRVEPIYRVPLLELGPYDLHGVSAVAGRRLDKPQELVARDDRGVRATGILGAEVLRKFLVTLDLKERRLHLVPGEAVAQGEPAAAAVSRAPDASAAR